MTKLVLKTVAITLASVIGAILLTFGAFALFSPITIANAFDSMGGYSGAIYFYEKQYAKTGSIQDLNVLVLKLDDDSDFVRTEKYLSYFISHQDFNSFCENEQGDIVSAKEFYYGKYALALVNNGKLDTALQQADIFVNTNGYLNFNPYSVILLERGNYLSNDQLDLIKSKIQSYSLSGEQLDRANSDISLIENLKTKA